MAEYEDGVEAKAESGSSLRGHEVKQLYEELKSIHAGRNAKYATNRDRYRGKHWGDAENPEPLGIRYTLVANYLRPTVDKTVQMLLGQMPAIQVMPPGVDETSRRLAEKEEALLYYTWEKNDAPLAFRRAAHNMALLGRGWLYYWWDAKAKCFHFRSVAPDNVFPLYDGEDIDQVVVVSRRLTAVLRRQYPGKDIKPDNDTDAVVDDARWARVVGGDMDALGEGYGQTSEARETNLSGQTTVIDYFDREGNWTRVMGDEVHSQNLGYGLGKVPLIEIPNTLNGDEAEPRTEIDDIVDLNIYLDILLSQQADIIKKYANPTIVDKQSGVDPADIKAIVQGEGGVLPIHRDGELEYLNWEGTPPDILNQYGRIQQAIYDLSGKPASSYGQIMTNQSGVATNMALSPATSTNEEKQSIFGHALMQLNSAILALYEKFRPNEDIDIRGVKPKSPGLPAMLPFAVALRGSEINGWHKNRIKWPSALRTDDPVYVQNELAKMQAAPVQAQSVYTTLERLGIEDVEAEIDRIKEQLADPRFHPDRMQAAVDASLAMQQGAMPDPMAGLDPAVGAGLGGPEMEQAAEASGSPNREVLSEGV